MGKRMEKYWGWVDRTADGGFIANDYAKGQVIDELPDEVMEVIALLDLLSVGKQLTGGSKKMKTGKLEGSPEKIVCCETYFITNKDIKPHESDI